LHSAAESKVLIIFYCSIWFEELQQVKVFRPTAASGQNAVLQLLFWPLVIYVPTHVLLRWLFKEAMVNAAV